MGKAPNGLGKFSGKVGGVVFAISNGEQIVRAYQPVVNNPKSAGQMAQRSKGNLVGQISSFVPKAALFGLGANARRRRAEFLRILLKAAIVTTSGDNFNAKIADEDVIFSKGSVATSVISPVLVANPNSLVVRLEGNSTFDPVVYASHLTRIVVLVYDLTSQELVECVTKVAVTPAQGQQESTIVPVSHPEGYIAVAYAIPMSTEDSSAASVTTDMAEKDDDDIAALLSVNGNAVVFDYGRSYVLGQANYTPSNAKEEEKLTRKKK